MKILWISPRWPFPADDGAKRATAALTLALADLGHEIGVVTFAREAKLAPPPHPGIRLLAHHPAGSLAFLPRATGALANLFGDLPFSAASFRKPGLGWGSFGKQDLAVIDGAHAYASFLGEPCPCPLVYRAHNVEASLWEQAAARSWLSPYFSLQARRMRSFEDGLGAAAGAVAAISPEDAETFRGRLPGAQVDWVPVGFPLREPAPELPGPVTYGYLGRLDWPPNREGLEWFLDEVWPEARDRRPDLRLRIAGSGNGAWLGQHARAGFELLGRVESEAAFYASVHAVIAPVPYGSGTRIKVVEAASYGKAAFATAAAHAGSGLPPSCLALHSEDPGEWAAALARASPSALAERGAEALTEARRLFEPRAAAERFLSLAARAGR